MTSAISARQRGDEFQQYLFWQFASRMLASRGISEVGYETSEFRAFDDVAVKYEKPRPDGLGGTYSENHIQSKFSVSGGKVLTAELLATPSFINASKVSLLERLKDAVDNSENEGRQCVFTLWSPWPIEQGSLLSEMIDTSQGALRLDLLFKGKTKRSKSGQLRACWAECLSLNMNDESELRRILSRLRIYYENRPLERIALEVLDIFPSAGLKKFDETKRSNAYLHLIQKLHGEGSCWFDQEKIIEHCKEEELWIGHLQAKLPAIRLGIRTFIKFAEGLEDETDEMICLTEYFSGRHIREKKLWSDDVLPRLQEFLTKHLEKGKQYLMHLPSVGTVAFTSGYLAEPKLGASFEIIQPGIGGSSVWPCRITDHETTSNWEQEILNVSGTGDELAVAISVTHKILKQVKEFANNHLPQTTRILHLSLSQTGQGAVNNGDAAFNLVSKAVEVIKEIKESQELTGQIHLFWAAPNGMVFMLGQMSRGLGTITLHEYDFDGTGGRGYSPSLSLSPFVRLGET